MFDHGHFTEHAAGADLREHFARRLVEQPGDFDQPFLDDIDAVAGRALAENFLPGGEFPFEGDLPQRLHFVLAQTAKKLRGFERDHARTLGKNRAA